MIDSVGAAAAVAAKLGGTAWVVKAQVHAGGRGKGGGVKLVQDTLVLEKAADEMLGSRLKTKQTGEEGLPVNALLVEQTVAIEREIYFGMLVDRGQERVALMVSAAGGMNIEEVAEKDPDAILTELVNPAVGLQGYQVRQLAFALGLSKKEQRNFAGLLFKLADLFEKEDCSIAEINPLILTDDERVVALDAKVNFDSNAEFRHAELWGELRDLSEEAPTETEAKEAGLSFIQLDGNIGCLVNGAGLAMSTMDTIKYYGGEPANFLDVGGGASQEAVTKAFRIILQSEAVQGIFVNIFGGIMRCDTIANGVVAATKELGLKVPLVVRLEGTKVEEGRKILDESGLAITSAATMAEGAQKIVELAKG